MSYRSSSRYRRPPPRRGMGCLAWTAVLIWIAVALVAGYLYWVRPQISRMVGEQVARQAAGDAAAESAGVADDDCRAAKRRITDQRAGGECVPCREY